ncbi:hypothetical protein [Peptoniphilus porci]|nr:hypothetical protein [Peptoniphilus porci]
MEICNLNLYFNSNVIERSTLWLDIVDKDVKITDEILEMLWKNI